jgi:predicted DNA-binding ribbon-helix-helix protein
MVGEEDEDMSSLEEVRPKMDNLCSLLRVKCSKPL